MSLERPADVLGVYDGFTSMAELGRGDRYVVGGE